MFCMTIFIFQIKVGRPSGASNTTSTSTSTSTALVPIGQTLPVGQGVTGLSAMQSRTQAQVCRRER